MDFNGEVHSHFSNGQVLSVSLGLGDKDVAFTCIASNPVSWDMTTVTPWESCHHEAGMPMTSRQCLRDHDASGLSLTLFLLLAGLFGAWHHGLCSGGSLINWERGWECWEGAGTAPTKIHRLAPLHRLSYTSALSYQTGQL